MIEKECRDEKQGGSAGFYQPSFLHGVSSEYLPRK
jgi:hypothetical protein